MVEADPHLGELNRYLHLNPVRIRTHSQKEIAFKREIISTYRWSSYQGYTALRRRDPFVTYGLILSVVGGKDDARGRRKYREFVLSRIAAYGLDPKWDNTLLQQIAAVSPAQVKSLIANELQPGERDRRHAR